MQTILHLTDIHFGWEGDSPSELAERKICLDGLLIELSNLESEWKPTIICLTGDIGWKGSALDYSAAKEWLDRLLNVCCLSYNSLIVCAGNHDIVRPTAKKVPRPKTPDEADEVLAPPVAEHFQTPFAPFISFCQAAGIPSLDFGDSKSYLIGERTLNGVHFVVLNSAWFCKDEHDKEKLWMGYPHLKFMEAHNQMELHPSSKDRITVALVHHPQEWFNEAETHAHGHRPNVLDYLSNRCHLLLTGHTHGEVRGADRIADQALHFTGGSAYAGASHFNSFRLIRLTSEDITDRAFEFNPGAVGTKWKSVGVQIRSLSHKLCSTSGFPAKATTINIADLRSSCRKEATRLLTLKSRLLRQSGQLPTIIERPVSLRVSAQRDQFDETGRIVRPKDAEQTMPLFEAVRQGRRTLLLGDLGTGKSTLTAQLVIETIDRSETAMAILIPVKILRLTGHFTRRELLASIVNYVEDVVCLSEASFPLENLLNQQVEMLLAFDGLDELPRDVAGRLLSESAAIVENWPTVQVIATARPVELVGTSFSDWRIIHTVALDDAAKCEFLQQELIADNVPLEQVNEKTKALLRSLKENTSLNSVANSPLTIRLIFPRLNSFTTDASLTLGDLLYDVLIDRLGGWEKRDDKPSTFLHLNSVLPTAEAKAEYLAILADRVATGRQLQRDESKSLLSDAGAQIDGANRHRLSEEALSYFEWLGLISVSDTVDFPIQPLAEVCAATGLVAKLRSDPDNASLHDRVQWRIASFAATIARRRGLMNELRKPLATTITFLLGDFNYVPAACYIVVESADPTLAKTGVQLLDNTEYRPLRYLYDERKASARNIAKTLALAGNSGFDWFYNDYLHPSYPIPNAGCAIVGDVFSEWAALIRPHLTAEQIQKLEKLIAPYRAGGEGHFYGVLATLSIVAPLAFPPEERICHQSVAMDNALFTDWVESEFRKAWDDVSLGPIVDRALLARSGESISAARLWLERNPSAKLPHDVIRLAMRLVIRTQHSPNEAAIAAQCEKRVGDKNWMRFARWFLLSKESSASIGAAKVLYNGGERRLSVLGEVAMSSMHDGGYVTDAELILKELIKSSGETGVRWLVHRIANAEEWHGSHSGWWRVLLPLLDAIHDGPHLLAICIRSLGPYTLPRNPEVRESFARVLKGSRGVEFRDTLRISLKSYDPQTRRGAALILVSSDPYGEADVLFVAVRSRANPRNFDWHEWESFLLTLELGPSVLSHLKGRLNLLEPQSRALALILLDKGGFELDSSQRSELLVTLSSHGNWHLSREPAGLSVLSARCTFELLKKYLESPSSKSAEIAAERLIEFHQDRMTALEKAKCFALRHAGAYLIWELPKYLIRIAREPEFARNLIFACDEIVACGGPPPLLGIAARAITEQTGWKDVLWRLLCDDAGPGGSSECDNAGMALLEFGLEVKMHQQPIGEAAKACLADPRFKQNRWHETYHWVALLADEFVGLDENTIREAILHGRPIGYSATIALIARLGYVPKKFYCEKARRRSISAPASNPPRDAATIVQELIDFGRDSDELHPQLLASVQSSLFTTLDEPNLAAIAASGKPGILITTLLRYLYGQEPRLSDTIPLLDILAQTWSGRLQEQQLQQLTQVWRMLRESAFLEDEPLANAYLAALDLALVDGRVWKLAIAVDILAIRGELRNDQIPIVLGEYSDHVSFLHDTLYEHLCVWLSQELNSEMRRSVVQAAEQAIIRLNEAPWFYDSGEGHPNPWANLLFPAIVWAHGQTNSNAAEAVFLRGIRAIFGHIPHPQNPPESSPTKLLRLLAPILARSSPDVVRSVIDRGSESFEPSISVFCTMIKAFHDAH